jgi:hypothetical protein
MGRMGRIGFGLDACPCSVAMWHSKPLRHPPCKGCYYYQISQLAFEFREAATNKNQPRPIRLWGGRAMSAPLARNNSP